MIILQGLGYIVSGAAAMVAIVIGLVALVGALVWAWEGIRRYVPSIIPLVLGWVGRVVVWAFGLLVFGIVFYQLGHDLWT